MTFPSYISAAMLDEKNKEYFDLSGALVYDPCIGQFDYVQEEVPAVPFVVANNNLFNFNESFIAQLESLHKSCGYADYIEKYLTFPASGVQPPIFFNYSDPTDENCDVFDLINFAAFDPNPCFDIYEITTMVSSCILIRS
jgi:carboxypeptidase D